LPAEEERTGQNTEEPKEEFKEIVLLSPSLHESKHVSVFGPLFGICSQEGPWKGLEDLNVLYSLRRRKSFHLIAESERHVTVF
jgi:hypothetical protein